MKIIEDWPDKVCTVTVLRHVFSCLIQTFNRIESFRHVINTCSSLHWAEPLSGMYKTLIVTKAMQVLAVSAERKNTLDAEWKY